MANSKLARQITYEIFDSVDFPAVGAAEKVTDIIDAKLAKVREAMLRQWESHESLRIVLAGDATFVGISACVKQCEMFSAEAFAALADLAVETK